MADESLPPCTCGREVIDKDCPFYDPEPPRCEHITDDGGPHGLTYGVYHNRWRCILYESHSPPHLSGDGQRQWSDAWTQWPYTGPWKAE